MRIRALPGIGDYTAAAVGSIAFDLPYAVLDGNVLRVVARVENDAADIAAGRTRERFREIAQQWLDPREPGHFNQALMELGATVCLPRNPLCLVCPLSACCRARQEGTAAQLPVKLRKTEPVRISGVPAGGAPARPDPAAPARGGGEPHGRILGSARVRRPPGAQDRRAHRRDPAHHHASSLHARSAQRHRRRRQRTAPSPGSRIAQLSGIPFSTTARKALQLAGIVYKL